VSTDLTTVSTDSTSVSTSAPDGDNCGNTANVPAGACLGNVASKDECNKACQDANSGEQKCFGIIHVKNDKTKFPNIHGNCYFLSNNWVLSRDDLYFMYTDDWKGNDDFHGSGQMSRTSTTQGSNFCQNYNSNNPSPCGFVGLNCLPEGDIEDMDGVSEQSELYECDQLAQDVFKYSMWMAISNPNGNHGYHCKKSKSSSNASYDFNECLAVLSPTWDPNDSSPLEKPECDWDDNWKFDDNPDDDEQMHKNCMHDSAMLPQDNEEAALIALLNDVVSSYVPDVPENN